MKVNKEKVIGAKRISTLWIIWGLFTIFAIYVACHHEPWYDEYHVWVMCKHLKMTWIWSHMVKEGHFVFWYYLVYPFVRMGCSFWCLQLVGVSLVSAAVWVVMMKSPFDLLSKCLVAFCYPMLYLFPVVARCYALVPILLFLSAWLYANQKKNPYLYCFFVGLIAHTHVYMEGLVGSLFLLFCYEQILKPYKKREKHKRNVNAAIITIVVVIIAFLQVVGSLQYANDHLSGNINNLQEVFECLFFFSGKAFPLPGDWHQLFPSNVLDNPFYIVASFVLWIIIAYNLYVVLWKQTENRKFLLVFVGALGWQIWVAMFVFGYGHQRLFLPILILLMVLWLAYRPVLRKNILIIISCLFLLTSGYYNIYRDIKEVFSEDTPLFNYVEKNIKPGEKLYFTAYFIQGSEYDLYYQYDIHFIDSPESYNVSSPKCMTKEVLNQAFDKCEATNTIYLFSDRMYENVIGPFRLTMLTNIGKYYIYKADMICQNK